jgi:hypothetical protein
MTDKEVQRWQEASALPDRADTEAKLALLLSHFLANMKTHYIDLPPAAQRTLRCLARAAKRARDDLRDRGVFTMHPDDLGLYAELDAALGMAGTLMPEGVTLDEFLQEGE